METMKIPKEIKTKHKVRDCAILQLYLRDNLTQKEIGSRFGITGSRVEQILSANSHLISWNQNKEKAVRINALKRLYQKHPESIGNKCTLDVLEQLRKEIDGDKPLIDQSTHITEVTYVWESNQDKLSTSRISTGELESSGKI